MSTARVLQTPSSWPCVPFSNPEPSLVPKISQSRKLTHFSLPSFLPFHFFPPLPSGLSAPLPSCHRLPLAPHAYAPNPRLGGGPADALQSWQSPKIILALPSSPANHCLSQRKLISTDEDVGLRPSGPTEREPAVGLCALTRIRDPRRPRPGLEHACVPSCLRDWGIASPQVR